jgi:hypothetical protein
MKAHQRAEAVAIDPGVRGRVCGAGRGGVPFPTGRRS